MESLAAEFFELGHAPQRTTGGTTGAKAEVEAATFSERDLGLSLERTSGSIEFFAFGSIDLWVREF